MTEAIASTTVAEPRRRSYVTRHWKGELSLAQAYWVNGALVALPFNLYFQTANVLLKQQPIETPIAILQWIVVPFLIMQPVVIWQGVGIWRSAGRRIHEGKLGWSWVARIIVLTGFVLMLSNAVLYTRLVWSLSFAYFDQRDARYQVSTAGNIAVFSGEITPASADALISVLQKQNIDRLVIRQSIGGYVLPSLRVAKVIRDRKVTVVTTVECASMCAALLASGGRRYILPTTIIRMHRPTQAGTNDRFVPQENAVDDLYRSAGMKDGFLTKINSHSGPRDLYEPTMREIIDNGLATSIFDKSRNGYVTASQWCEENSDACDRTGSRNASNQH